MKWLFSKSRLDGLMSVLDGVVCHYSMVHFGDDCVVPLDV